MQTLEIVRNPTRQITSRFILASTTNLKAAAESDKKQKANKHQRRKFCSKLKTKTPLK